MVVKRGRGKSPKHSVKQGKSPKRSVKRGKSPKRSVKRSVKRVSKSPKRKQNNTMTKNLKKRLSSEIKLIPLK